MVTTMETRALDMKSVLMKILAVVATGICIYRVINTTDLNLLIFGSVVTVFFASFTGYLLFEKRIKTFCRHRFPDSDSSHQQLLTLCFYTVGSYFLVFLFLYGTFTGNNILLNWPLSKIFFYILLIFFVAASIYCTVVLMKFLIRKRKSTENRE